MRFHRNKWKIVTPVLIMAVLAATFYFGGNAPGSKGWDVGDSGPSAAAAPVPFEGERSEADTPAETLETPAPAGPVPDAAEESTRSSEPTARPEITPAPEATPEPAMERAPETGKDGPLTKPVPEEDPLPAEPGDAVIGGTAYTCTISISCAALLNDPGRCDPDKAELIPEDGWILKPLSVTFYEGESVFNVLQRVCKQQKIHMEYEHTPIYNSAYIEGIHNLYEFDAGELSGWMYQVNEWFPNYGCSQYRLHDGDVICWMYTCDLGSDIGGGASTGNGYRG